MAVCCMVMVAACALPPGPVHAVRAEAPVDLEVTTSRADGVVHVSLQVRARAALPSAMVRFVLLEGVKPVAGALETLLGPLSKGESRRVAITLGLPAAALAAGVDVVYGPARKLHKGMVVTLNGEQPRASTPSILILPSGEKLRVAPAVSLD